MVNMKEDLYRTMKAEVRPAPEVPIKPTIIQSFDGTVTLHYIKDGKMEKQGYTTVERASKFALEELGMKPILFEKGWVQGQNGHPVEIEPEPEKN